MEALHGQKTVFQAHSCKRGEKGVLTKGFLQLSPEAAMVPGLSVETHPPPPVPPFLLVQNLSPKDIARSDITS